MYARRGLRGNWSLPTPHEWFEFGRRDMTENDYIAKLEPFLRDGKQTTNEALLLANESVQDFPNSAALWLRRGKLYCAAEYEVVSADEMAARSFEKAIELDPGMADAYEALADYHDGIRDDPKRAMEYYRKAAQLRGEPLD